MKYYTPKLEEFVEGFQYEVKTSHRMSILDTVTKEISYKSNFSDIWHERVVPKLSPNIFNEDPLRLIRGLLKDGYIRAKINNQINNTMSVEVETVTFDVAVEALKQFKRVGFRHWAKDTFIFMQVPATIPFATTQIMQSLPRSVKEELERRYEALSEEEQEKYSINYRSQIAMMLPDGTIKGYSFSPSKVLSKNWIVFD